MEVILNYSLEHLYNSCDLPCSCVERTELTRGISEPLFYANPYFLECDVQQKAIQTLIPSVSVITEL